VIFENIRNAMRSIYSAKLRSFLTMLGIIIGVSSVALIISIGDGVKQSVANQVSDLGTNIVQVNPGSGEEAEGGGEQSNPSANLTASLGSSTLTQQDVEKIGQIDDVAAVAPMMLISGLPTSGQSRGTKNSFVLATTPEYANAINLVFVQGSFFSPAQKTGAVIPEEVAVQLYGTSQAVGRELTVRGKSLQVTGVIKKPEGGLNVGPGSNITYIPYEVGKDINGGTVNIFRIVTKVAPGADVKATVEEMKRILKESHGGETDFTVLTQEDSLKIFDSIFSLLTTFVVAIASISLVVGGIGIMNIMLVSVSERTREIGIRKAIGATFGNIMGQFLSEAVILSCFGGLLGLGIAYLGGLIAKRLTGITPILNVQTILLAVGVSVVVGVVFGVAPAIKAARKRPIQALKSV
jgi:ABC-type antimicrobial peptide transport system permease subunit